MMTVATATMATPTSPHPALRFISDTSVGWRWRRRRRRSGDGASWCRQGSYKIVYSVPIKIIISRSINHEHPSHGPNQTGGGLVRSQEYILILPALPRLQAWRERGRGKGRGAAHILTCLMKTEHYAVYEYDDDVYDVYQ